MAKCIEMKVEPDAEYLAYFKTVIAWTKRIGPEDVTDDMIIELMEDELIQEYNSHKIREKLDSAREEGQSEEVETHEKKAKKTKKTKKVKEIGTNN